jgi:hypothetical protein
VVYLPADLKALVAAQVERVQSLEQNLGRIIPHLFPHTRGPAPGGADSGFSPGVTGCLPSRSRAAAAPRLPSHRRPESGTLGCP